MGEKNPNTVVGGSPTAHVRERNPEFRGENLTCGG
jgi:hypothetical protein